MVLDDRLGTLPVLAGQRTPEAEGRRGELTNTADPMPA